MQLFITPSKNILMTGISLGSTMICLIIIIGILQYKEKVRYEFKDNSNDLNLIINRKLMRKNENLNHRGFILMVYRISNNPHFFKIILLRFCC